MLKTATCRIVDDVVAGEFDRLIDSHSIVLFVL